MIKKLLNNLTIDTDYIISIDNNIGFGGAHAGEIRFKGYEVSLAGHQKPIWVSLCYVNYDKNEEDRITTLLQKEVDELLQLFLNKKVTS